METMCKIAFGGGCHWCTEAVFQSLKGVQQVEQGFIASDGDNSSFSEAVIVHYDENVISLKNLITIHLFTHESTSQHALRNKYRSAIYYLEENEKTRTAQILMELQADFDKKIITGIHPLKTFKPSDEMFHDYYFSNKKKPFCKKYINPKLNLLSDKFSDFVEQENFKRTSKV